MFCGFVKKSFFFKIFYAFCCLIDWTLWIRLWSQEEQRAHNEFVLELNQIYPIIRFLNYYSPQCNSIIVLQNNLKNISKTEIKIF